MLPHHGGRLSCRGHEHKALKTHNTLWARLSGEDAGDHEAKHQSHHQYDHVGHGGDLSGRRGARPYSPVSTMDDRPRP